MPFPKLFLWKVVLGNVISSWGEVSYSLKFVPFRWQKSTEICLKQLNRICSWFFIFNAYLLLLEMPNFWTTLLYSHLLPLPPSQSKQALKFYFAIKKVMVGRLKSMANSPPHGNILKKNILHLRSWQSIYVSNSYKTFT